MKIAPKSLFIYTLANADMFNPRNTEWFDKFSDQLNAFEFSPCGSQDFARTGWTSAAPGYGNAYVQNGKIMLVAKTEQKIIPPEMIARVLAVKVEKMESEQLRKLKKTEKDSLRDEVLQSLLPRAFTKHSTVTIFIDTDSSRIYVSCGSPKKAEDALALLRKSIGSLPVIPVMTESPVELTLTDWVKNGDCPNGLVMGDSAVLKAILTNGGTVRAKDQDLVSDEILNHIEAGKVVTELSLNWHERLTFTLTDSFTLKKIKFTDSLLQQNDDIDREDLSARFDADFILIVSEIALLIEFMIGAVGGLAKR